MESDSRKLFRTALSGFNKEDVMEYIGELSHDHERMEKDLSQKVANLSKTNESLNEQIKDLMRKLDETIARVIEADKKTELFEQEINELKEKNKRLEDMNSVLAFSFTTIVFLYFFVGNTILYYWNYYNIPRKTVQVFDDK